MSRAIETELSEGEVGAVEKRSARKRARGWMKLLLLGKREMPERKQAKEKKEVRRETRDKFLV